MSGTSVQTKTQTARRLVPLDSAADHLGVSPRTLRRRIADGSITGYRMGPRIIRVDLNEVEALLTPIPTAAGTAA